MTRRRTKLRHKALAVVAVPALAQMARIDGALAAGTGAETALACSPISGGVNVGTGQRALLTVGDIGTGVQKFSVQNHDYVIIGGGMGYDSKLELWSRTNTPEGPVYDKMYEHWFSDTWGPITTGQPIARVYITNTSAVEHPYYYQSGCK